MNLNFSKIFKYDAIFSVERSAAENAKRELAATVVKYEAVSTELCEFKAKVQARDDRINELKREIDSLKSENATMNSLIVALRTKLKELEGNIGGFETVASKSEITITTLQRENRTYQQQLLELESRIRYLWFLI
jgi:chromosome segregation ATPase